MHLLWKLNEIKRQYSVCHIYTHYVWLAQLLLPILKVGKLDKLQPIQCPKEVATGQAAISKF